MNKFILILGVLFTAPVLATGYGHKHPHEHDEYALVDHTHSNTTTVNNYEDNTDVSSLLESDNRLARGITAFGAIAALPSISHLDNHSNHSGVSLGVSGYDGNWGLALGLEHQWENFVAKGAVGTSGSEEVISVGGTLGF